MPNTKILESTNSPEQKWIDACNKQGWDDSSQVIHLEGFIRDKGLFAEFAAYASMAAEQENSDAERNEF